MVDLKNDNQKVDKNSEARAAILDYVSPYFEPLYEIFIEDFVKKYNIQLPNSFFFFFSMFVFSIITIYFDLSYQGAMLFLLLSMLILIARNRKLISNLITQKILLSKGNRVNEFIKQVDEKELDETKKFILSKPRELTSKDLISLMESKFYDNASLHLSILNSQIIESELLEYMINNQFDQKISEDIFCDYLKYCSNSIPYNSYESLATRQKNNLKMIQTLNACYPLYLKNHSFFKFFAKIRIQIKESINYGRTKNFIFLIWFFLGFYAISTHPISSPLDQIATSDATSRLILNIISSINLIISFLLTVSIFSFVTLFVMMWLTRRYRTILCYLAPKSIE